MRVLLDTHTFLWWLDDDSHLSVRARQIIGDGANEIFFSAASGWEIAIKAQIGKLTLPGDLAQFVTEQVALNHFIPLPIHLSYALAVHRLPLLHRDPFDRMLIAQSQLESLSILTVDPLISQYAVQVIW